MARLLDAIRQAAGQYYRLVLAGRCARLREDRHLAGRGAEERLSFPERQPGIQQEDARTDPHASGPGRSSGCSRK